MICAPPQKKHDENINYPQVLLWLFVCCLSYLAELEQIKTAAACLQMDLEKQVRKQAATINLWEQSTLSFSFFLSVLELNRLFVPNKVFVMFLNGLKSESGHKIHVDVFHFI